MASVSTHIDSQIDDKSVRKFLTLISSIQLNRFQ